MTDTELDVFVGLLYLRGRMNDRSFPVGLLWSEKYGCQAFFFNVLDMAAVNSWILYQKVTGSRITRRDRVNTYVSCPQSSLLLQCCVISRPATSHGSFTRHWTDV